MPEHMAGVITLSCQSVWLRKARSLACHWQTHLPDATAELRNTRSLASYSSDIIYIRDGSSSYPNSSKTARISRKVEKQQRNQRLYSKRNMVYGTLCRR
jgi:hypothetical protein